jgi:hypothetical protein
VRPERRGDAAAWRLISGPHWAACRKPGYVDKEGFDALSDKVLISIVSHIATSAIVSSKKVRITN